eukprot:1161777-Pelagomonas_calceolata.AAC.8
MCGRVGAQDLVFSFCPWRLQPYSDDAKDNGWGIGGAVIEGMVTMGSADYRTKLREWRNPAGVSMAKFARKHYVRSCFILPLSSQFPCIELTVEPPSPGVMTCAGDCQLLQRGDDLQPGRLADQIEAGLSQQ